MVSIIEGFHCTQATNQEEVRQCSLVSQTIAGVSLEWGNASQLHMLGMWSLHASGGVLKGDNKNTTLKIDGGYLLLHFHCMISNQWQAGVVYRTSTLYDWFMQYTLDKYVPLSLWVQVTPGTSRVSQDLHNDRLTLGSLQLLAILN